MADISTPTVTPITDAVLRLIGTQLRLLERAGVLTPKFEIECSRDGSKVKHCNILLMTQDQAIIPEDLTTPRSKETGILEDRQ